jgi:hypothetical protein
MGNHPNLSYRGGQEPILHLEYRLDEVLEWADGVGQRWAISFQNAGATYANFSRNPDDLARLNWAAIQSTDFRDSMVKEAKQAEFLVKDAVPWTLVRRIGASTKASAEAAMRACVDEHRPRIELMPSWYY